MKRKKLRGDNRGKNVRAEKSECRKIKREASWEELS